MPGVNVKWTGQLQFLATDEKGHTIVTGSEAEGFRPPDLLLAAVAGCAGIDVVRILEKKRQNVHSIEANVRRYHAPDPPWCIEKIEVEWIVRGQRLSEKAVKDAVELAEEKYCSVTASLNSAIVTTIRVEECPENR